MIMAMAMEGVKVIELMNLRNLFNNPNKLLNLFSFSKSVVYVFVLS
jgi:hypothetical protein